MKRFDKKFKSILTKLSIEIELYKRFVHDITAALAALDPGVKFNKDEMKMEAIDELVEADKEEHSDKRTFGELMKIANSLYSVVQLTIDTPSSHLAGTFPVLDLQMWDNCLLY